VSTIKSSDEHLTIKFQANGVEKASISSSGAFTSTTIDATKLTGTIPNFTSTGIDDNADATAITIDSNENVGIGVTPESDWYNGGGSTRYHMLQIGPSSSVGGYIDNSTYLGSNWKDDGSNKYINTDEASLYKQSAGVHSFMVAPSGSADAAITWTTAMTIDNSGDVILGLTNARTTTSTLYAYGNTSSPTGNCGLELAAGAAQTRYLAAFSNSNGHVGSISTNGSATSFNTSSDYRLKENVVDMENATDRVKQLKPKRFNFIADDSVTVDGFLAHEVQDIVPEAITGEKDAMTAEVLYVEGDDIPEGKSIGDVKTAAAIDPQGIDQSKLVPLLVKTIQELEARIAALEA